MGKSIKKANKTSYIRFRTTTELKDMAQRKSKKAGLRLGKKLSMSAWIERLIKRARG